MNTTRPSKTRFSAGGCSFFPSKYLQGNQSRPEDNQLIYPMADPIRLSFRVHFQHHAVVAFLILIIFSPGTKAQGVIDRYIDTAFSNNLVIRDKQVELEKGLLAIKEARSLFLPTTWFETQYTLAQGGRSINIPIGDLLNPVYSTLNQLTSSNRFPVVSNVKEQFLPNNFYDVRIKTTMPVIHPEIGINRDIKQQEVKLKENDILIYKRELAKEIKQAYYQYLMAGRAVIILEESLSLVRQNLRVNQSLLNNGKGLPAYVTRAESEVLSVENQLLNARNSVQNAAAYFNFLLNRPLSEFVLTEDAEISDAQLKLLMVNELNISAREEISSLGIATAITDNVLKMNRSYKKPRLNAFLDFSAQDFGFNVNRQSFFYLGGLQLQIPIYAGKRNLYRIGQTEFDLQRLRLQTELTRQQLELAGFNARNNARNAHNTYLTALKQEQAAAQYFRLMDRGYAEGVASFIEFLDARTQYTAAKLQANINKYRFLSGMAEYERHTASYDIR
jgi:outer membrane protein TolC